MKKSIHLILLVICAAFLAQAQLKNTKWKGTVNSPGPVDVLWDFGKDTVVVIMLPDSAVLETMTYQLKDSLLLLTKVTGSSPCSTSDIAKYRISFKADQFSLTPSDDPCDERKSAVNSDPYTKVK
jgi:hypothetical protein